MSTPIMPSMPISGESADVSAAALDGEGLLTPSPTPEVPENHHASGDRVVVTPRVHVPGVWAGLRSRVLGKAKTRRERIVRIVALSVIASGSCVVLLIVTALVLSRNPPAWFAPPDGSDPDVIAAGRRIENNVATVLTKIRRPAPGTQPALAGAAPDRWAVSLSAQDANAWLCSRLAMWMECECDPPLAWPKEVGAVQVAFEGGRIYVAASLRAGTSPVSPARVVTASLEPVFDEDGSLWMPARTIGMGRMAVPASLILGSDTLSIPTSTRSAETGSQPGVPGQLADLPQTKGVLSALAGRAPVLRNPVLKIGDGRRVKLVKIEPQGGKLIIWLESVNKGQ